MAGAPAARHQCLLLRARPDVRCFRGRERPPGLAPCPPPPLLPRPGDTSASGCGPAPMLDAFEAASARLGLTDARVERFSAPVVSAASTVAPYPVVLQRNSRRVDLP